MGQVKAVVVGHGHPGHFGRGDAAELAIATGATFIAPVALVNYAVTVHKLPLSQSVAIRAGESIEIGGVELEAFEPPHPPVRHEFTVEGPPGEPNLGYLARIDGKTLVHVGDTTPAPVYADIAASHVVDLAMLPLWAEEMVWDEQTALDSLLTVVHALKPRKVLAHARYRENVSTPRRAAEALKGQDSVTEIISMRPGDCFTVA